MIPHPAAAKPDATPKRPFVGRAGVVLGAALLAGCASFPRTPAAFESRALVRDYWEAVLERSPTYATFLGDARYNGRLEELGPEARAAWLAKVKGFEKRAKRIRRGDLPSEDRVTLGLLRQKLEEEREEAGHKFYQWNVDQMDGPQSWFAQIVNFTPLKTDKDAADLEARLRLFPRYFTQYIGELEEGLAEGRVPPRIAVERVLAQVDEVLKTAPEASPWGEAIAKLPEPLAGRREILQAAVKESVYPAYTKFRDFLRDRCLERSRTTGLGLGALPGGQKAYRFRIRQHTTLPMTADELHALGLSELEAIRGEMRAIARRSGAGDDLAGFLKKVKSEPANFFTERDDVEAAARAQTAKIYTLLPAWFGRLPRTACEVKRIEGYREKDSVAAFYYQPPDDLARPGIYYINTYAPSTRPRYGMAALAAHEAVPGHHLQIAIALEAELPPFRRNSMFTAFTEGWGLYSERLADEMGLYPDDLSRFGMLTYQAWRACRLVVDTGLHAKGWTRDQAIEFMSANAPLSREEIVNEVDRYIIWPGQALAYMVGQKELLRLRDEAKKELGGEFDIRAFHDVVLENGSIPLPVLRQVVRDWVTRVQTAPRP